MHPVTVAPDTDGNDRLVTARPEEFTERFREAITDDFGAVAHLHQLLETASEWCRAHGARRTASELDDIADRLTDLGEELHLVRQDVAHEIHYRSRRTAAAARVSPAASPQGTSVAHQSETPVRIPPSAVRSLPRSL
ncbi:hypothetical protein OG244_03560 [Streptomyces brevispora]|uniref:hypothetical protein n=1 Tax=Streptomyces brevispora TaxID=887462 RepID=UPI002E2FFF9D|nr:hypothetical protein [Streptomyces brevispora]